MGEGLYTSGCTSILKPGKVPVIKMKVLIFCEIWVDQPRSHARDPTVPSGPKSGGNNP
jgi:hypothetical protein